MFFCSYVHVLTWRDIAKLKSIWFILLKTTWTVTIPSSKASQSYVAVFLFDVP